MIGATGVGKTEIAAPPGEIDRDPVHQGRSFEIYRGGLLRPRCREHGARAGRELDRTGGETERVNVEKEARRRAEERLLDLLAPAGQLRRRCRQSRFARARTSARGRRSRHAGRRVLEDRKVELTLEQKSMPMMFSGMGMEQMDVDLQGMFEKILPKQSARREMTVAEARRVIFEQECDAMINQEKVNAQAIDLAQNLGIIFLDEIDKVVASENTKGADVSRQGVQRDLLPIVEGTTVQTKYGYVSTDHVLFIAAGAFHRASPSDLMPELQGRFPIRVELQDLTKDDFVRILTEPKNAADEAILGAACRPRA